MLSLTTSVNDLILQRTLLESTLGLDKAITRLTTGYKVNNAKDNAAGYSIIENLNTKISSMLQTEQNAADGLAMLGIMEGGLDQIIEQMQRLRNLAIDSANGTYDAQSREAMQTEADSILETIDQIKSTAQYDNKSLFQSVSWVDCDSMPVTTTLSLYTEPTDTPPAPQSVATQPTTVVEPNSNVMTLGTEITGSTEVSAKGSKTVTIDGVQYKLTNTNTTESASISWSKDTTTGVLTFNASSFIIEGQSNVAHNLVIKGSRNTVWGGNLDDTIQDADTTCNSNTYCGEGGDDTLKSIAVYTDLYGGTGNDTLTKTTTTSAGVIYGGDGDDIIYVDSSSWGTVINGEDGNDTFNFGSSSYGYIILGGDGDDSFSFAGTREQKIDGGSGTNTITGTPGSASIICNTSALTNGSGILLNANSTGTLTIDGKNYEITNNMDKSYGVLASVVDGTVQFVHYLATSEPKRGSNYFDNTTMIVEDAIANTTNSLNLSPITIKGEAGKAHSVKLVTTQLEFIGGDLDDEITLAHAGQIGRGGAGNDTIIVESTRVTAFGDEGDDIISTSKFYNVLYGGSGNDTITSSQSNTCIIDEEGTNSISTSSTTRVMTSENSTTISLNGNETKEVTIGGKTYSIKNLNNQANALLYQYDSITGVITFSGQRIYIQGADNQEHNVKVQGHSLIFAGGNLDDNIETHLYDGHAYGMEGNDSINVFGQGNNYVYAGSGNDTVTLEQQAFVYGNSGNDTFNINYATSGTSINGEAGNDIYNIDYTTTNLNDSGGNNTFYVNANNSNIVGGSNKDTFYINSSGNTINGGNGDDHFVIDNTGANTIDGSNGINTAIDNSGGAATLINISTDNCGLLNFYSANETQDLVINGTTYTFTNTGADGSASANNSLMYSYNSTTGELRLEGGGFTITSSNPSKLLIRGDNNKISGTSGNDSISIESGTNNIVDAGNGDDTLTMDTAENTLIGGAGNDTLVVNATTTKEISGGDGNDVLVLNSSNNTDIDLGNGNNTVRGSGSSNNINLGDNKNVVNLRGSSNTITSGSGDDSITIEGDSNTIIGGDGNNTISLDGSLNNLTLGSGADRISLKGNENEVETGDGNSSVSITGSSNAINCGAGNDEISIRGNTNEVLCNDGYDNITIKVGDSNVIDGGNGEDRLIDKGSNTVRTNVLVQKIVPFKLSLKIDTGYDENSFLKTDLDLSILDLELDLTTRDGALEAIQEIDDAISSLRERVVELGGIMNRIENIMEYQTATINSLVSTRSTFRDADIAKESSEYVRYQILQQASATLMSSCRNLRAENVLGLLQGLAG